MDRKALLVEKIAAFHKSYSQSLDPMLRGLLTETPTTDKLQHLLEHIHFWIQSKKTKERVRAIQSSAALLEFATILPGFDTSSDFSKAGDFVLQLGLHVSQPADDISRQARGGIYWTASKEVHGRLRAVERITFLMKLMACQPKCKVSSPWRQNYGARPRAQQEPSTSLDTEEPPADPE
ncbi:maestro heat-like repeat family member 5 [Chrysemys picta bellii]|uniref:maestro heat-like repeat family member 5 n=1 Tax=Chrysemys picta bellii TaxID=8478 RepID=UPI0032B18284